MQQSSRKICCAQRFVGEVTLNKEAFRLARFIESGLLSSDEVRDGLGDGAAEAGLDAHEIPRTLKSGINGRSRKPRAPETGNGCDAAHQEEPADSPQPLDTVNIASLAGKPVPHREWLVNETIPLHQVTLFTGDGGQGKSLLAIQLAVATA